MLQQCPTSDPGVVCSVAIRPRKALVDKSESTLPFPFKLHQLLEEAEECGTDHIISWLPSGEAFKIHDPDVFLDSVMTKYFKMTKIKSFTRQLYIYGFTKISKGPNMGGFFHPEFRRDDQKACMTLSRRDGKEDRRVKANKPKMLEDLQRSLARGRAMSCIGSTGKEEDKSAGIQSVRNTRIPQSLLKSFPSSLSQDRTDYDELTESSVRPKKAYSLFDQTFGDELDMDDLFVSPTLGPISALETKALPAPPCSLRIDLSKQLPPRPSVQRFPEDIKSTNMSLWSSSQLMTCDTNNDPFHVEPRSIEEMLQTFQEDGKNPFPTSSFFGPDHFAENSFQMMET